MKIAPDCIVCNLNAGLTAIREVTSEKDSIKALTIEIMKLPAMRGLDWSITGSQLVEQIFTTITAALGDPDPFKRWKKQHNDKCLSFYPLLRQAVTESQNPLFTAVNLAIMGNSIDPMGLETPHAVEQVIRESLTREVSRKSFADLEKRLRLSELVLYLGDNCGEIVYDKLLIETIKSHYDTEVVFVVRSVPTLNDATTGEAKLVGMDDTATVIENGIDGPFPGTILSRCSERLRELWSSADLVMSKGGGNFDSLDEEEDLGTPLYYMLMSKCMPYREYFNVPLHYPILSRAFTRQDF